MGRDAREVGAETCVLTHRVATTKKTKDIPGRQVDGFNALISLLMDWQSYDQFQLRPFDTKELNKRWENITGSSEIGVDDQWAKHMEMMMATMEMSRAYQSLGDLKQQYTESADLLLGVKPGKDKAGLYFHIDVLQQTKKSQQKSHDVGIGFKAGGAAAGVGSIGAAAC